MTARLLSINVGLPQDIDWQGKTVHTAIWKAPVQGPRLVRRLHIDGDGQGDLAGHGGEHRAVFVYQINFLIAIGKASSAGTISPMDSSGRTSRSMACRTRTCALATDTGSVARCSR